MNDTDKKISRKTLVNRGLNKLLLKRREELHFSLLEAAIKLDIYKWHLKLIEKGYVSISKKLQEMYIYKYDLPKDFFDNDLNYPVEIKEEKQKKTNPKFINFFASWYVRVISILGSFGFIALALTSLISSSRITKDTASFFDETVLTIRNYVKINGEKHQKLIQKGMSEFKFLIGDDYYLYPKTANNNDEKETAIGIFDKDENIEHSFFQGQVTFSDSVLNYTVQFESRCSNGYERFKTKIFNTSSIQVATISADYYKNKYIYNYVKTIYSDAEDYTVNKDDFFYSLYTYVFENSIPIYQQSLSDLVDSLNLTIGDKKITFNSYHSSLLSGSQKISSFTNGCTIKTICGITFASMFIAIAIASIFFKTRIAIKLKHITKGDKVDITNDKIKSNEITFKELNPNLKFRPIIPEFVLRIVGLVMIFYSSIGIYYFVKSITNFEIIESIEIYQNMQILKSLSAIAIIFIFFIKIDIIMSKRNAFLTNYILFFCGLIYYFILMSTSYSLSLSDSIYTNMWQKLLVLLPGNFIWGILAFNLLGQFLFCIPQRYWDSNKKIRIYNLIAILPILYLLISLLFTILEKGHVYTAPLWFKNLLFSKSTILIIFAIVYCLSIYIYNKIIEKKYGESNARIYETGARFFFIKNLIAVSIVIILGIVELIVHFTVPNGTSYGFGQSYLIILATPFMLLYHPHLGNRNTIWDLVFGGLNGIAMGSGVILLLSILMDYLLTI